MISFDVNKKALQTLGTKKLTPIDSQKAFSNRLKNPVEACGATQLNLVGRCFSHPFVEAAHIAFAEHYPLVLTPDSVWLCIAQGFANHINVNAEALRKRFVSHEGKKAIIIERNSFRKGSPDNDWQGAFSEFSDKLAEYIGKKRDLVVSNFSTTSVIEKAASEVVLMDSMKSYFKFGMRTMCGIPSITLMGSVDDWRNIRTRAENLIEYDLDWWAKGLLSVTDHLVKAAEGNPDVKFFDSLYKEGGGSGGPFASGWMNVLFPYLEGHAGNLMKNTYAENWDDTRGWGGGPTLDAYTNGLAKVPFKWQVYGTTYDMELLGGLVGVAQDETTLAVTPTVGWAVRDTGTSKEGPIDENEDW